MYKLTVFTWNFTETVRFQKISIPGNQVKLHHYMQWIKTSPKILIDMYTVDACYLEQLLSRTFTISNFLAGPLNVSSNSRLKNIRYLNSVISNFHYLEPII